MANKIFSIVLITLLSYSIQAQSGSFGYEQLDTNQKEMLAPFYLPNTSKFKEEIALNKWKIYNENADWIYFSATAKQLHEAFLAGNLSDYYIDFNKGQMLADSMRLQHKVNLVHEGVDLSSTYKGKDVIIGVIDTGIDVNHPDFKDANGKTRVIRYWDQTLQVGGAPSPYSYGTIWDSTMINAGLCTSMDNNAHGTTVAGAAAGNGLSTGYNQGVAPEADIIVVQSQLSSPNWAMTVAQSCEYIFKVADSLGKPAVVNISLGNYLGSHDGTDPASLLINNLLDEKNGRIVVSACGNSGAWGKFHCHGDVTAETNFTWFANNPSSVYGPNKIFFDLYADTAQSHFEFNYRAINPANNYQTRGVSTIRYADVSTLGSYRDTIWNEFGQRIATIETYRTLEGPNVHMQVIFRNVDSTNYYYGFYTKGTGSWDLWSGTAQGYNTIIEAIPSAAILPEIVNYNLPDAFQTIVTGWTCSPKVVAVGNVRNRQRFPNLAGGEYVPSDFTPNGKLSPNSSKGPTRHQVIKPNVTASGDVMLTPGPLWFITHPGNATKVDTGGMHMGNGGTSMASPVVAGVAALYLERCKEGNYQGFLDLLTTKSMANAYTGSIPNNSYGYGLVDAHAILLEQEQNPTLNADTIICHDANEVAVENFTAIQSILWSNNETSNTVMMNTEGTLSALVYNQSGCGYQTDTLIFIQGELATIEPITISSDFLQLSTTSSNGVYQWTKNGVDLVDFTDAQLTLETIESAVYDCYTTSIDGCITFAGPAGIYLSVDSAKKSVFNVFPNPAMHTLTIQTELPIFAIEGADITGKKVDLKLNNKEIDISNLNPGYYILSIETLDGTNQVTFIKK